MSNQPNNVHQIAIHAQLLDVGQTAVVLNVTPRFIRRLIAEHRIPFLKIG